jgi:MtrB/PioB family decaheme-associated outer membrane protein
MSRVFQRSTTTIENALLCALLAFGLFVGGAVPAAAETEVGEGVVSGEIEAGGRMISGDFDSAKFSEYQANRPGGYVTGFLLSENKDRSHYVRTEIDFWDENEQRYLLGLGRYGHYGVEFEYEEFPHNWVGKENVLTPYSRGTDGGRLTLPGGWDYGNAASGQPGLQAEFDANARKAKLGFRQINGRAGGYIKPQHGLEFTANYDLQDKRGTRRDSIMWGFTNFASIAEPIDERIHQVTAGGTLARENFTFGVQYLASIYDNEIPSNTVDNPLCAADGNCDPTTPPGGTTPGSGRQSVAPDNSAHQISLSGSGVMPTPFPSRLLGTFAYGVRLQDDNFLPYTVNSTLTTGPLPKNDLDGEVKTMLFNLVYTARPSKDWNFDARYRLYDLDNNSNTVDFSQSVASDTSVSTSAGAGCPGDGSKYCSVANEYRRQNADVNVSWRAFDMTTLRAGFGWENWRRSKDREVRHSNEYGGNFAVDMRPAERLQLLTAYKVGYRDYNSYFPKSGGASNPALRRFDQAQRLRNAFDQRLMLMAQDNLTFSANAGFVYDYYFDSKLGLRRDRRWNVGFDVAYTPYDWLGLSTWWLYDHANRKQRSATGTPGAGWTTKNKDKSHTVGVDLGVELIPELLDWDSSYALQIATANSNTRAETPPGASFPKLRDTSHNVDTKLTWHALEQLDLIAGYQFSKFDSRNFYTDELGTVRGSDIYLNNRLNDYDAHIFTLGARYEF